MLKFSSIFLQKWQKPNQPCCPSKTKTFSKNKNKPKQQKPKQQKPKQQKPNPSCRPEANKNAN